MKKQSKDVKNRQKTSGEDSSSYFRPKSKEGLLQILRDYEEDFTIIAGGTDLLVEHYQNLYKIDRWLDLNWVSEFKEIKIYDDKVEIGSMVTHERLYKLDKIKELYPVIQQAAADVGSPQIRSRGTIGGNIVTSSPAGDLLPPLLVYDAKLKLISKEGERVVDANEFFTGPKRNVMENGEIVEKIILPLRDEKYKGAWVKVGKRKALVISSISLALNLVFDEDEKIKESRICIGSAAPVPLRIESAEEQLLDKKASKVKIDEVAQIVADEISPIDDIRGTAKYRRQVAFNITKSALSEVINQ
ncbi:MAG TPA: xanthine dehydrogenase family protein subunit M [Halanaerobiales bacterium]|nr:xanthine dehydrogenase family protein subunit M [Halanaerobiales bacterium]